MGSLSHLTSDDLRAGDILLHQPGRPRWYEKGIAWCTASPYTHASIYIGDNTIAEARMPKVRTCCVLRAINRERALCVLRQPIELSAVQIAALHGFVDQTLQRGARFDLAFPLTYYRRKLIYRAWPGPASGPPQGPLGPSNGNRYFCASFIVDAYCAMGLVDRSEKRAYRLGRHAPADFLLDEKFGAVVGCIAGRQVPRKSAASFAQARAK